MKKKNRKNKLILTAILGSFGLVSIMGLASYQKQEYKSAEASIIESQNVIYNDEEYKITLSNEEVNYTLNNFTQWANTEDNGTKQITKIKKVTYQGNTTTQSGAGFVGSGSVVYAWGYGTYQGSVPYPQIRYDLQNKYFRYVESNSSDPAELTEAITLEIAQTYYEACKSAIELDIQANQPVVEQGDTMISAIASGMGLIPDIAKEFVNGFTAIFWDSTNSQLTSASTFMLVFLGVAIVMAIIKLCLMLLRNNTGA